VGYKHLNLAKNRPVAKNKLFNARAETVQKNLFKSILSEEDAVIPADGFMNGNVR